MKSTMVNVSSNKQTNGNHVHPQIPPIVSQMGPFVIIGIVLMQAGYGAFYYAYEHGLSAYIGLPPASEELCQSQPENDKCGRPDLFAFQMVSGLTFILVGGLGLYMWHVQKSVHRFSTPEARLYGFQVEAKWLTVANLAYQLWDFGISLTIPEHRTPIMLTHHAVAATVSFSGLYNYMLGYYAAFFLGLSEVSSIFLVSLDLSKYFQPLPGTLFEAYISNCAGPLFVVCFIYYRVILWWPVSKQLFDDVRAVTASGQAEALRPGRTWILYLWVTLNFPMGLLQLYWLTLILAEVKAIVAAM